LVIDGLGSQVDMPLSMSYLDSPSSTSSLTYTAQFRIGSSGTAFFGEGNLTSCMTLMEIR